MCTIRLETRTVEDPITRLIVQAVLFGLMAFTLCRQIVGFSSIPMSSCQLHNPLNMIEKRDVLVGLLGLSKTSMGFITRSPGLIT